MTQFRSIPWAITCLIVTIFCGSLTAIVQADIGKPFWAGYLLTLIFLIWTIRTVLCWNSDRIARQVWKIKSNRYRKQHKNNKSAATRSVEQT